MIDLIPNVTTISFPSSGTHYEVRSRCGHDVDRLLLRDKVRSSGATVCAPENHHLPENLNFQCHCHLDCYGVDTHDTSLFVVDENGQQALTEALALPAWQLLVWDQRGDNREWISMLKHRTEQGIVT